MQLKNENKHRSVSRWDEALADAKQKLLQGKIYVAQIRAAIKLFESNKADHVPWRGNWATKKTSGNTVFQTAPSANQSRK